MKAIARSYVWWPKIDKEIEEITKRCTGCVQKKKQPQQGANSPMGMAKQTMTKNPH